jgi:hypothetical protein
MAIDLSKTVADAFKTVSKSLPDAVKTIQYVRVTGQVYNPATGLNTDTTQTITVNGAIFLEYTRKEKEYDFQTSRRANIEFGDQKCLIPATYLTNPSLEDYILEGTTRWRIVEFAVDPTKKALYTFQLRKAS